MRPVCEAIARGGSLELTARALRTMTGEAFGFVPDDRLVADGERGETPDEDVQRERQHVVETWRSWFREHPQAP